MIELKAVSKIYGSDETKFQALKDINIQIADGVKTAIVGKSGSGKSTLMHVMSGLERPSLGNIIIGGKDISKFKEKEIDSFRASEMGFIFQSFFIEPKQTCYYNVSLPLEIKGVKLSERKALIDEALKSVNLFDKTDVEAGNLSGGQKQRLAIARAIVNKPRYIFADEPTGNLDTANGQKVIDILFKLNKALGSTICIVTHDHDIARLCDEMITIADGEVKSTKNLKTAKGSK